MQFLKQLVDYASFHPTVKTFVDHMPIAVFLWQPPPLAAIFTDIQQCVDKGHVLYCYVPPLYRQYVFQFFVLLYFYLHFFILPHFVAFG